MKDYADIGAQPDAAQLLEALFSEPPPRRASQDTDGKDDPNSQHGDSTMSRLPKHDSNDPNDPITEPAHDPRPGYSESSEPPARTSSEDSEDAPPQFEFAPYIQLGSLPAPAFPVDALPDPIADWVREVAEAMQVRPDIPAVLALGVASAAAMYAPRDMQPRVSDGAMQTPLQLYAIAVEESGANKSAVLREAIAPLRACFDSDVNAPEAIAERARLAALRTDTEAQVAALESEIRDVRKAALKGKTAAPDRLEVLNGELAAAREKLDGLPPVPRRQLFASDATPEAMVDLLDRNPVILLCTSEGNEVFDLATGRYGKRPNFDWALKAWDSDPMEVNRKGALAPLQVDSPTLAMAICVQPVTVRSLASLAGDLNERGFTPRLLFAWPETLVGHRTPPSGKQVNPDIIAKYAEVITRLFDHRSETGPMTLSPEAKEIADVFYVETEARLADGGEDAWCRAMPSKMRTHLLRFAGIMHLATGGLATTPVSDDTAMRAWCLSDYFLGMGRRTWAAIQEPKDLAGATKAWDFLRRWACPLRGCDPYLGMTARDLFQRAKGSFSTMAALTPALDVLEAHGYLVRVEKPKRRAGGQPASPWLVVNPDALQASQPATRRDG